MKKVYTDQDWAAAAQKELEAASYGLAHQQTPFGVDWAYESLKMATPAGLHLGLRTTGFEGSSNPALPPALAPAGQYYVYPDGNLSNAPGPGAIGPFSKDEASIKSAGMKLKLPPNAAASPIAPSTTAPKATTPNFITPYVKPTGFGAFGEKDVF